MNIANPSTRWPELQAKAQQDPHGLTGFVHEVVNDNAGNYGDVADAMLLEVVEPMQERIDDLLEALYAAEKEHRQDLKNREAEWKAEVCAELKEAYGQGEWLNIHFLMQSLEA